jgi:hypothetical protein
MWRDGAVPYEAAKYLSILLNVFKLFWTSPPNSQP